MAVCVNTSPARHSAGDDTPWRCSGWRQRPRWSAAGPPFAVGAARPFQKASGLVHLLSQTPAPPPPLALPAAPHHSSSAWLLTMRWSHEDRGSARTWEEGCCFWRRVVLPVGLLRGKNSWGSEGALHSCVNRGSQLQKAQSIQTGKPHHYIGNVGSVSVQQPRHPLQPPIIELNLKVQDDVSVCHIGGHPTDDLAQIRLQNLHAAKTYLTLPDPPLQALHKRYMYARWPLQDGDAENMMSPRFRYKLDLFRLMTACCASPSSGKAITSHLKARLLVYMHSRQFDYLGCCCRGGIGGADVGHVDLRGDL